MLHSRLQMVMTSVCCQRGLIRTLAQDVEILMGKGWISATLHRVMRLRGDTFWLLVLDTLWLGPDLFRASMSVFSTISWLMLLAFSFSHFSSLPVVISAPLGAISQGAEE